MNRANQQALFQQTNQAVLDIRQLEIDYYTSLYGVVGTQATLVGGFAYSIVTQNNNTENAYLDVFLYIYFIFAALTLAASLHVLLCTMLLQVYGPGLAINGPLGSMVRATEGMRSEQGQVIGGFFVMIASFILSTLACFWCVMTTNQAIISTVCFCIIIRQSWFYCERIYLRFYWDPNETKWNDGDIDQEMEFDDEPRIPGNANENPTLSQLAGVSELRYKKKKLRFGIFGKKDTSDKETVNSAHTANTAGTAISADAKGVDLGSLTNSLVSMEGYFTSRGRSEQQVILDHKRWVRQYFVLFRTGEFYVYKSRQKFREDPKSPVYSRPLRLTDFHVKVDNSDEQQRAEFEDDGRSVASSAVTARVTKDPSKPLPFRFQITLVPRENEKYDQGLAQLRNHWLLRCDTEEELEIWLTCIREVCPSCFDILESKQI